MKAESHSGYKFSEFGFIPEEWGVKKIGDLFRLINGAAYKPSEWRKSGVPIIRIQNLNDSLASYNYSESITQKDVPVNFGDLLFAWSGTVGSSFGARVWYGQSGVLNQHIFKVEIASPALIFKYALLIFKQAELSIAKQAHGFKASFVHVKKTDLLGISFPLPSLVEQEAIATALSDTDTLIESLEQLIAKKRLIKQGTMQELLTGKRRLPGFSGEWEVKRLGDIGRCLRGVTYKGDSDLVEHDTSHTKRLLRSNNVQMATVVKNDLQFVSEDCVSSAQILKLNDILICMANGSKDLVGKSGLFCINDGYEYTFGAFMGCFRVDSLLANQIYISYLFQTEKYRSHIKDLLVGSSINNLNPSSIESFEFHAPLFTEQTAIASILSDMDTELTALESQLEKTRAIKQGMMQSLLTGRIRLLKASTPC